MSMPPSALPPEYKPVNLEEYRRTHATPESIHLPYSKGNDTFITRSPYHYLPNRAGHGMFSDAQCTVEGYWLKPIEGGASLWMTLWNGAKCVRGYDDWMLAFPSKPGVVNRDLAWRVYGSEGYYLKENDVFSAYLDVYYVDKISPSGIQFTCVTDTCPLEIKPLDKCRPIPCKRQGFSPLFRDHRKPEQLSGYVRVSKIGDVDGVGYAEVSVFRPDVEMTPDASGDRVVVKVGEQLGVKGFQSYTVRRIVVPQEVKFGGDTLGKIREGWIEIDVEPTVLDR